MTQEIKDSLQANIPLSDSLTGLVDLGIRETTLSAVVAEFTEGSREIEVRFQDVPSMQESLTLDPPIIEVRYRVPLTQYQMAHDANDFLAFVSYDSIRDDTTGFITPDVVLPQGVLMRDVVILPSKLRYYDVLVDE